VDIAFIVSEFPSLSETFVVSQIIGLLERGHRVDIFAQSEGRQALVQPEVEKYRLRARAVYLNCPRNRWRRLLAGALFCARRVWTHPRAVFGALNFFCHGRYALSLTLLFATMPFYRKYDIVHCHFGPNGLFGAILKRLGLQPKLAVTFHGYDIRRGLEHSGMYRALWREADCVMAISEYNRERLVELGADPKKIVYHPVGVDLGHFRPCRVMRQRAPGAVRLLSVGRLVEEKGFSFGIRAVDRFVRRHPETRLSYEIVGEGKLREDLEQLIRELGLQETVFLRGAKEQDAILGLLQKSDIFFAPSLSEALPVALMEAQAAGLPVIATVVGSVEQIVKHGRSGFLVEPGDAEALADSLEELVRRRAEWPAMGRIGREHVDKNFNIERLNDRLVELYRALLAA